MIRILSAAALAGSLVACGSEPPVRQDPQATHPSPSALAQGTSTACGVGANPACAAPTPADGSAPIID